MMLLRSAGFKRILCVENGYNAERCSSNLARSERRPRSLSNDSGVFAAPVGAHARHRVGIRRTTVGALPGRPHGAPRRAAANAFTSLGQLVVGLELGRRLLGRVLGRFPPGRHTVAGSAGAPLSPGVYRVRLRAGGEAAERILIEVR